MIENSRHIGAISKKILQRKRQMVLFTLCTEYLLKLFFFLQYNVKRNKFYFTKKTISDEYRINE